MKKLTPKQARFCEEYLIDLNATQAAIRAGYSGKTAYKIGAENLSKLQIQEYLSTKINDRSARTEITADNVLKEIAKLAFADLRHIFNEHGQLLPVHQLPPAVSASISSVKVKTFVIPGTDPVEVEHVTEIKLWDKGANLERLGKHLKLFNEVGSKENPFCLEELTDEQLMKRIAARKTELGL